MMASRSLVLIFLLVMAYPYAVITLLLSLLSELS